MMTILMFQLLIAHLITDFVLQPKSWVKSKQEKSIRSSYLWLHVALTGIVAFLFLLPTQQPAAALLASLAIAVSHLFIDWWKLEQGKDNLQNFLIDQLLHVLVLAGVWVWLGWKFMPSVDVLMGIISQPAWLATLSGFIIVIWPAGFVVAKATEQWRTQRTEVVTPHDESLEKAGRYIGILERVLVLIFVLAGFYSAVGFLIAAKSILRYSDRGEANPRKQTEYVLVGTLLSFSIAIVIGLAIQYFSFAQSAF